MVVAVMVIVCGRHGCGRHGLWPSLSNPVAVLCEWWLHVEQYMMSSGRRNPQAVLIISYETFRLHAAILHRGTVGLVICDEVAYYFCYSNIIGWSVALYAAETWTLTEADRSKLEALEMLIGRRMEKINWVDKKINEKILKWFEKIEIY